MTASHVITGNTVTGAALTTTGTFTYKDIVGGPQISLKAAMSGVETGVTITVGQTVNIPAGALDANEGIDVLCYGAFAGTTAPKHVSLYAGNTILNEVVSQATSAGNFKAHFLLFEHTDGANQGTVADMLAEGGTVLTFLSAPSLTTVNMAQAKTLAVKIRGEDVYNRVTLYGCVWAFLP
jgi:hypothetical protein